MDVGRGGPQKLVLDGEYLVSPETGANHFSEFSAHAVLLAVFGGVTISTEVWPHSDPTLFRPAILILGFMTGVYMYMTLTCPRSYVNARTNISAASACCMPGTAPRSG